MARQEAAASAGTDAQLKGVDMELTELEKQHQEYLRKEAEIELEHKVLKSTPWLEMEIRGCGPQAMQWQREEHTVDC